MSIVRKKQTSSQTISSVVSQQLAFQAKGSTGPMLDISKLLYCELQRSPRGKRLQYHFLSLYHIHLITHRRLSLGQHTIILCKEISQLSQISLPHAPPTPPHNPTNTLTHRSHHLTLTQDVKLFLQRFFKLFSNTSSTCACVHYC